MEKQQEQLWDTQKGEYQNLQLNRWVMIGKKNATKWPARTEFKRAGSKGGAIKPNKIDGWPS